MLDDLQEKYFDEVRALLPLHRIFLFILGLIVALLSQKQTHKSILETILNLNINSLSFDADKLLESAQIWHVLIGFGLVFISFLSSQFLTSVFFKFLIKKTQTKLKIEKAKNRINSLLSRSRNEALELIPYYEKQSDIARKRIIRSANSAELSMGVFICFFGAFWLGNILDLITCLIFFILSLISTYFSVFLFYSKYLKFDLLRSVVSGVPSELELPSK